MNDQKARVIPVALIGLGQIGCRYDLGRQRQILTHAHAISKHENFKLIAAADANIDFISAFENYYNAPTYTNVTEMLENVQPELIVVATSTESHVEILKRIVSSPGLKAVLCEKPLSKNLAQSSEVAIEYSEKNIGLYLNYQRRASETTKKLIGLISSAQLGAYLGGTAQYTGGYLNSASHLIDILEFMFDSRVTPSKVTQMQEMESDYSVNSSFRIKDHDFYLQRIETEKFSIFEAQLIFEKYRIRYCSGGEIIYLDQLIPNEKYADEYNFEMSTHPWFINESSDLLGVYNEIWNLFSGQKCNLLPGEEAVKLINRMYKVAGIEV